MDGEKPGSKYGEELSPGVWSGMLGEVNILDVGMLGEVNILYWNAWRGEYFILECLER